MKNILKIRNNSIDTTQTGVESSAVFSETYPGLFNFYVNPGSDGSFISSYWSQDYQEYVFAFSDAEASYIEIEIIGGFDSDDFEFNEKITTQVNQAMFSSPGGGVVDITNLPVLQQESGIAVGIGFGTL